jgi:hypothetical protein
VNHSEIVAVNMSAASYVTGYAYHFQPHDLAFVQTVPLSFSSLGGYRMLQNC